MLSPEQSPSIPSIRLKALITTMTMSTVSGVDIQSGMAYIPKIPSRLTMRPAGNTNSSATNSCNEQFVFVSQADDVVPESTAAIVISPVKK